MADKIKEGDVIFEKASCHTTRSAAEKMQRKHQDENKRTRIKQDGDRFCLYTAPKPKRVSGVKTTKKKSSVGAIVKNPTNLFDRECDNKKFSTAQGKGACSQNGGVKNKKKK
jgi:hypothetical protein